MFFVPHVRACFVRGSIAPYANLFEATGYTVSEAASVKDVAGNPMVGPYSSVFTTSGQSPSVSGVDPPGGPTAVAVDRNIVVTFSEAMERNSAQSAFSLRSTGATGNLGGSFSWDVSSTVMTFNPYANLAAGSSYTVAEAASATDIGGNPMATGFTAAFRTAP